MSVVGKYKSILEKYFRDSYFKVNIIFFIR